MTLQSETLQNMVDLYCGTRHFHGIPSPRLICEFRNTVRTARTILECHLGKTLDPDTVIPEECDIGKGMDMVEKYPHYRLPILPDLIWDFVTRELVTGEDYENWEM